MLAWALGLMLLPFSSERALAQPYAPPDRGAPGDEMIQAYLSQEAARLSGQLDPDLASRARWEEQRPRRLEEYYYMLGLSPRPASTPLQATVTGTLQREGYTVELLHYQSRPGLYVTGNLYRPDRIPAGQRLPAVFYVCGHSARGRNGNKVAYQSHGIWLARHGYVCLMVDSLQLGEIASFHHGTYNLQRWWWHSRGYTPAGVEAWNGMRGIDYLSSRPDVDPERIGVSGISGGGAATFWIAAADPRVKAAVPVSGMADLDSYVSNRVINGHCDCMFLYNAFQWPWTRIAALAAPRPMLFVNSDHDSIFPMDANERISARMERLYSLYGAGDRFDTLVSVGGHAYRQDIRQGTFRFLNSHLKGEARPVEDSEVDLVSEGNAPGAYPIDPQTLRVFPAESNLPPDEINTRIDDLFVPRGHPAVPAAGRHAEWRQSLRAELRRVSFAAFPETIPAATRATPPASLSAAAGDPGLGGAMEWLQSETGIYFTLRQGTTAGTDRAGVGQTRPPLLVVLNEEEAGQTPDWLGEVAARGQPVIFCEPRGIGATRWTRKNPPNYVERSHLLLGRTVDTGRVWDVVAAAKFLLRGGQPSAPPAGAALRVEVAGRGAAGIIALYAALWDDVFDQLTLVAPPLSHQAAGAPQFLNVMRVADIPEVMGALAPRRLSVRQGAADDFTFARSAYAAAGAGDKITFKASP